MKQREVLRILLLLLLFALQQTAFAGPMTTLDGSLRSAINSATSTLQTTAVLWLSSFILLQFLITNLGLLKSGADIEAVWAKFLGSLLWFGVCFYIMQEGTGFIDKVSQGFFSTAANISGAENFDAGLIINQGAVLAGNLLGKINSASGITDLFMPSLIGGLLGCVILGTAAYIGFKVFIIKLETMIIIMMAPLSFAFLGLNALRDQGIAPFKSLISLLYRVILLALIIGTMKGMSDNLVNVINSITEDSIDGIWSVLFAAVIGYLLLAFLAYKSDSIAASLASGSTNLGTSDAATAAAIGAAVGGAIGSAGATLGMGKTPQLMGDFMKQAFGGGGVGMSNATPDTGTGGVGTPPSKTPDAASMSRTASGAAGDTASAGMGGGGSVEGEPSSGETSADDATATSGNEPGADGANTGATGFEGVPNRLPEDVAAESRRAERNAAREERRQARTGGSGSHAAIEESAGAAPTKDASARQQRGFRDRLSELNDHVANEKASVHVSINTHHE